MPINRVPDGQPSMFDLSSLSEEVVPDLVDTRGANGKRAKKNGPSQTTPEERRAMQAQEGTTTSRRGNPGARRWDLQD